MIPRLLLRAMLKMDQVSLNVLDQYFSEDLKLIPIEEFDRLLYSFDR